MATNLICPLCNELAEFAFSKKISKYRCSECDEEFEELPKAPIDPQTIFLSYAHKSEREEDYDISEELVLLVKEALEKDGHTVWIDQEGIQGGHNWRENITRAILSHDHFLSFLSKRSVRDPGVCLNEIAIALDKGVNFQTVLTEPEDIVKPPITVTDTQWHQFVGWKDVHSGDKTAWDAWFEERMNGIRAQIEDVKNARAPGELTILRRALNPTTFYQDIAKKTEGFFGRKWLFKAFDHWLDKTNDRVFWLKGSPGIGKSAFAAKLVHQSNSRIMGFFKCDFQALKSPEESAGRLCLIVIYRCNYFL
jgi:TIR domain